jgi:hypothetical protein
VTSERFAPFLLDQLDWTGLITTERGLAHRSVNADEAPVDHDQLVVFAPPLAPEFLRADRSIRIL